LGSRDVAHGEPAASGDRSHLALACVLAWLLPGAGHWYLGHRARAGVFFCLVALSFVLGAVLHGRFSVKDPRAPLLSSLQVMACLGVGPMEIVGRSILYGAPVYFLPEADAIAALESRPPRTNVGRLLRSRNEARDSAYGTAYLWTAGLMNLLLILDVFDIGVGRKE
jgi:uncharacterized protein DUF6677